MDSHLFLLGDRRIGSADAVVLSPFHIVEQDCGKCLVKHDTQAVNHFLAELHTVRKIKVFVVLVDIPSQVQLNIDTTGSIDFLPRY